MGGAQSTLPAMTDVDFETYEGRRFSVEVPNTREATRGAARVDKPVYLNESELTLYKNLLAGVAVQHGNRPLYGTRAVNADGTRGEYEWMTYNEVLARTDVIAAGLTKFAGLTRKSMVGIYSKNRVEWCLSAHACDRMSYILVPLYDTLGPDAVPYIVNHTDQTLLICANEQFDNVLKCKDVCPTLKYIVQFEHVTDEQRQQAMKKGVELKSFREIEELGEKNPIPADPPSPEDIATLCYTSGTTGNPKGVILTQKNITVLGWIIRDRLAITADDVHISYLPLPHSLERAVISTLVGMGGSVGFYCGNVLTLMDDVAVLKPTGFISVPRLFNRIYDKINDRVNNAGVVTKMLFDQAYASKKAYLAEGHKTHALWDTLVFSKIRAMLGGRLRLILSGSAPLRAEVKDFMKIVFSCDVYEGYGLTETAAAVTVSSAEMPLGPHVGTPLSNCEIRLEDVPEMGYTSNDKPRPRGEVLCRGPNIFTGYYKEPEKTAEVLDKDGWLHTGDIGCWNADGTLSIIDRKKNIFKLSQGEYVAAEKIENIYLKCKYIAQVFVYGDSFQSVLVGVAVPDPDVAMTWATRKGLSKEESTLDKLLKNSDFQKDVMDEMTRVGKEEKLRGFEFVKKLHLHADAFTLEEGLITPTFKLKRPQLKAHFQEQINAMYAALGH
ncbi:hypothetical protein Poli38472_011319 [Pythium oligandrum]|uniref:Long-chain-fatty-acid--CoA ligase n=1 Tax=Pythium oligandrum TaxID=41045 RepID=A0A8K1CR31_PYTOL|nr:hypothetical protein Poli38472_011319 [Pythium oligandrum]|eukprot:TMW67699.1 hypothetical protein Poli38472_011319 [Pythium oligandrum]